MKCGNVTVGVKRLALNCLSLWLTSKINPQAATSQYA